MRRISKVVIAFTILAGILMVAFAFLLSPTAEKGETETATVSLGAYRYETVGYGRHGREINALIFQASDGEEYEVAMFYKDEAKTLSGHTITIRYLENQGHFDGICMIVEMTEGENIHYTLEDWNRSQRTAVWVALLFWGVCAFSAFLYVMSDVCGIFGRAKRHRRYARQKNARKEQLAELQNRPRNFPNTTWQTEDGTLTLTVAADGIVTGSIRIQTGDGVKTLPISFDDTAYTTVRIAEIKAGKKCAPYVEIWEADYGSPHEFTAKPVKTTYFKKGKTITVRRADGRDAAS